MSRARGGEHAPSHAARASAAETSDTRREASTEMNLFRWTLRFVPEFRHLTPEQRWSAWQACCGAGTDFRREPGMVITRRVLLGVIDIAPVVGGIVGGVTWGIFGFSGGIMVGLIGALIAAIPLGAYVLFRSRPYLRRYLEQDGLKGSNGV